MQRKHGLRNLHLRPCILLRFHLLCYGSKHLALDPFIGLRHTVFQANGWLPSEILENFCIVTVAAIHTLGRIELVISLELYPSDFFYDIDELIDRYKLAAA